MPPYKTHVVTRRVNGHTFILRFQSHNAHRVMPRIVDYARDGLLDCDQAKQLVAIVTQAAEGDFLERETHLVEKQKLRLRQLSRLVNVGHYIVLPIVGWAAFLTLAKLLGF